ncbi:hypothetical protein GvMRE_IIg324 [endosymbiont GvMRE of Glomus versiforme]|nr:hypothetical protein GvMRE_IIg324 [endosymbiont GvMRE of Glomus versiforme]
MAQTCEVPIYDPNLCVRDGFAETPNGFDDCFFNPDAILACPDVDSANNNCLTTRVSCRLNGNVFLAVCIGGSVCALGAYGEYRVACLVSCDKENKSW